jgi:zinc protease
MKKLLAKYFLGAATLAVFAAGLAGAGAVEMALLQSRSPLVTFRFLFQTGAASDPDGKAGVASLTAAMIAKAGSRYVPYDQVVAQMYPMATSFDWQVDKEMTVFSGTTHIDNLEKYYDLVHAMILNPGFRGEDFERLKADAIDFLKVSLREGNDEELGKEELYNTIYAGKPYGHHNMCKVSDLEKLSLDDVRNFYDRHYTQTNLMIGMAGGFPANFPEMVARDFSALPLGTPDELASSQPALDPGMKIEIVQRETRSTAISIGFPIAVTRADKDYPALALISSYFGQHRSSNSHLYQRLREARGLNYGDYSYIEYFPRGMFQFAPDPNLGRRSQIFQIWIRPVPPAQGQFALRAALYEFDKLMREGLDKATFEETRDFLSKYVSILTQSQDARLGYALDSHYYGTDEFAAMMREALAKLTLEEVNRVLRERLSSPATRVVMITKDAEKLAADLVANKPSPMTYNSPKPAGILEEDKTISTYPIKVTAADVTITPAANTLQ